ncbi:DUF2163 domain-containing protein [Maritalea mediterranea]|uniref:DUF2163 domain-containing protein n=1 Tax=Maritalea mediterranea TaxID=2909667 RepID=A0ABS9E6V1_9HYPH|nr:DUF2163 domain-containing protein [Maritalea mediterranea]
MRQFSPAFDAHLKSGATSLCNCWLLTLRNEQQLGFTDHDQQIAFDGHVFEPKAGFQPSAMTDKRNEAVDTAEVLGFVDDERLTEQMLRAGLLANAQVDWWWVNWRKPEERHLMRRDYIGEIKQVDNRFEAELRSHHAKLNQKRGRIYQRHCDAQFGDGRCGIDANSASFSGTVTVTAIAEDGTITVTGLEARAEGWASKGTMHWQSGAYKNDRVSIAQHARTSGEDVLTLSHIKPELIEVGDMARVIIGCDKQFSTCRDKFNNSANFQGFPHIPGDDFVLRYPRPGDDLSGGVLFK